MFKKYRWNFVSVVLLVAIIGFAILDSLLYYSIRSYFFRQTFEDMRIKAGIAATILQRELFSELDDRIDELWKLTDRLKQITGCRISIIDSDGKVLTDSEVSKKLIPTLENHRHRPEIEAAVLNGWGQNYRKSATINKNLFYSAYRLDFQNRNVGFLRLAYEASDFQQSMNKILELILLASAIGLIVLFITAHYLGSLVTLPILRIVKIAQKISAGDLEKSFPTGRKDEVGKLSYILNDLTSKLKNKITQISLERKKLAYILDQLTSGILVLNNERIIIHANNAFGKIFDIDPNNFLGKKLEQMDILKPFSQNITQCHQSGIEQSGEFSFFKNGLKKFVRYQVGVFRIDKDEEEGILVQVQDISELRHLEAIRKNFVASASHELKTPLTAIIGYAETLKEGALDSKSNALRFVDRILGQAQRLEYLVSDLLKLSQLEHDLPLIRNKFNLNEVIDCIFDEFEKKAKQKNILLEKQIRASETFVYADRELIYTALENLIDNALKYTHENGNVTIAVESANESKVRISVKDNGIGIDPKYHNRIFQRFYRVDKARSREMGGTGLGLAIVKHIIERHESQIFVKSNAGEGSCFYFDLKKG